MSGADRVRVSPEGDLVLTAGPGEIRQRRPLLYQEEGGVRRAVEGGYVLRGANKVAFAVGAYDRARPRDWPDLALQ